MLLSTELTQVIHSYGLLQFVFILSGGTYQFKIFSIDRNKSFTQAFTLMNVFR